MRQRVRRPSWGGALYVPRKRTIHWLHRFSALLARDPARWCSCLLSRELGSRHHTNHDRPLSAGPRLTEEGCGSVHLSQTEEAYCPSCLSARCLLLPRFGRAGSSLIVAVLVSGGLLSSIGIVVAVCWGPLMRKSLYSPPGIITSWFVFVSCVTSREATAHTQTVTDVAISCARPERSIGAQS